MESFDAGQRIFSKQRDAGVGQDNLRAGDKFVAAINAVAPLQSVFAVAPLQRVIERAAGEQIVAGTTRERDWDFGRGGVDAIVAVAAVDGQLARVASQVADGQLVVAAAEVDRDRSDAGRIEVGQFESAAGQPQQRTDRLEHHVAVVAVRQVEDHLRRSSGDRDRFQAGEVDGACDSAAGEAQRTIIDAGVRRVDQSVGRPVVDHQCIVTADSAVERDVDRERSVAEIQRQLVVAVARVDLQIRDAGQRLNDRLPFDDDQQIIGIGRIDFDDDVVDDEFFDDEF